MVSNFISFSYYSLPVFSPFLGDLFLAWMNVHGIATGDSLIIFTKVYHFLSFIGFVDCIITHLWYFFRYKKYFLAYCSGSAFFRFVLVYYSNFLPLKICEFTGCLPCPYGIIIMPFFYRFETVYLDNEIRVVKDIRGDYLVVERAPYSWKE